MARSILSLGAAAALLGASSVLAQNQPACSLSQKCPKEAPCCSQYGQCGVGAYCLGGCDPRMSFSLDSCTPAPVCKSKTYPMNSMDGIVDVGKYLGDPNSADWVSQGEPLLYNGNILLTMPPKSVGTVLASTTYMWYGNVRAKLKTSRGAGVVTAFILFSDVKDEIDYEFVGTDLTTAQTNYYFQGIPNYDNSGNITGVSDTFNDFHTYEIQWTPDTITWLLDGKVGRVKKRSETWNATANQWAYPQTPSRVQLSLWPGGADTNAPGTINWAGGPINWNSDDIKSYGYDFATFGEITVECFNAKSPPGTNLHTSYTYTNAAATNDTVIDGDKPTILKSFSGSGLDMNAGGSTPSGTNTATGPVASVPGGTAAGPGSNPGIDAGSSGTTSSASCQATGFSQNCGGTSGTSSKSAGSRSVSALSGAVAAIVGLAAGALFL